MCHPSFILTALSSIILLASKFHGPSITSSFAPTSAETATAQFSMLKVIPISFFFTSSRSKTQKVVSCSLLALLLLCDDIHFNPGSGSNTFQVCTLNICSLLNPLKYTSIADLAESHHIDLFALTETWITSSSSTRAELSNATPPGFTLISCPRPTPATKSHIIGGGTAFLIREPASLLSAPTQTFKSFEISVFYSQTLQIKSNNLQCLSTSSCYHKISQTYSFFRFSH